MKLSFLLSAASFISTITIGASHLIPLEHVGNDGSPSDAFPLGLCQGDCDSDADCQTGLVCMQRSNYEAVPGCSGSQFFKKADFCMEPMGTMFPTPAPSPTPDDDGIKGVEGKCSDVGIYTSQDCVDSCIEEAKDTYGANNYYAATSWSGNSGCAGNAASSSCPITTCTCTGFDDEELFKCNNGGRRSYLRSFV